MNLNWIIPGMLAAAVTGMAAPLQAKDLNVDSNAKPVELKDTRDFRFCEMLVFFEDYGHGYNTSAVNDCPAEVWDTLDAEALAAEYGAKFIVLNGPKYWVMDSQTLSFGGTEDFGGVEAQWVGKAVAQGFGESGGDVYEVFHPNKRQIQVFDAGKKIYELVDPEGHTYVLQARGERFDKKGLETMGEHMQKLPEGWIYRVRILDEPLVLDLDPDIAQIHALTDEFYQYYTRYGATE